MLKKQILKSFPILCITLIFAVTGFILQVKSQYITKALIDNVLSDERSSVFLKANAVRMLIIAASSILFIFIAKFFETLYYKDAMTRVKSFYIKKLFSKKINEFQTENNATYFSNLTNDMEKIESKFVQPIYQIVYMIVQALISVGVLLYVNYILLLSGIGIGIILGIVTALVNIPIQKHEKQLSDIRGKYTVYVKEIISAFQIIKSNNLEEKAGKDFNIQSENVENKNYYIGKLIAYIILGLVVIAGLLIFGIILTGIYLVYQNLITIGTLFFGFTLMTRVINTFTMVGMELQSVLSLKEVFIAVGQNLKTQDTYQESICMTSFNSTIEFNNVSFNYGDNKILKDVHIRFEKGKKYLITGPSGGGKTTVLKLLRKYFNPSAGSIVIDGKDLKDITCDSYFKRIANIEQQIFLFEDTLRNNITLYKNYPQEKINTVIDAAGLTEFVNNLSEGLNYKITDNGKNISGGEKARIAVARGLITEADIILLDEAFASLDRNIAKKIEQTLLNLKDITVINVSHIIIEENKSYYDAILTVKDGGVHFE